MTHVLSITAQFLLVVVLSFVVICLVTSYARFRMMTQKAVAGGPAPGPDASRFSTLVSERLARERVEGKTQALLLVSPNEFAQLTVDHKSALAEGIVLFVEERLRRLVRSQDRVAVCEAGLVGILLDAPVAALGMISDRLVDTLNQEPMHISGSVSLAVSARIGSAAAAHGVTARALVDQAKANLEQGIRAEIMALPATATHHDGGQAVGQGHLLDDLTGVLKEAHVAGSLQKYVALGLREERTMSVLYVDVDYLRRYNEQYGRDTGDKIIRSVSHVLQRNTREEDLIGRCGVDEFVVALSAPTNEAFGVARRLVERVKKSGERAMGEGLKFTVSVGVAGHPEHGANARQLFEAARTAMQSVKRRGRNNAGLPDEAAPVSAPAKPAGKREQRDIF